MNIGERLSYRVDIGIILIFVHSSSLRLLRRTAENRMKSAYHRQVIYVDIFLYSSEIIFYRDAINCVYIFAFEIFSVGIQFFVSIFYLRLHFLHLPEKKMSIYFSSEEKKNKWSLSRFISGTFHIGWITFYFESACCLHKAA